ncbi:early growth response protein 1-B-like [Homarus americanus]|uniref:Ichor-like n=1 Tax=Homarus americanus TaxID=6706 RepID=A0A8J5MQW5_HOMAM|nr:early growth response protein 1-B-like [Homarus americanus]XP_042237277.1 early growth response protein 1-B-like [Homarus americanus]KAG7160568.1 Ichor-like [Homarus americanus]
MEASSTLHDNFKADFFDLVNCTEYDLSGTDLGSVCWPLDDPVSRNVNNNNVSVGDVMTPSWPYGSYQDPPTSTSMNAHLAHDKDKETTDKMWGGGGSSEKVVNNATGNTIIITFPSTEGPHPAPDTSEAAYNPSPPMTEHNNLELFNSILNEKPYDGLVSHNHRSPASDCVSYVSVCSGYSDSGISTSLEDTASPNAGGHDHVDLERLVDSAVDSLVYSPGAGVLGPVEDNPSMESNNAAFMATTPMPYSTHVTQSSDGSSILEGALRGTVRRPVGPSQPPPLAKISDVKTLTLMSNMTPLPPLTSAFKAEQLNGVAGSTQISSSNGMYVTTGYDYHPAPAEEYTTLDASFNKLSTATTTKMEHSEHKPKKRKYTKRTAGEEPSTKGRLLHFCHICNKGFKDKYSVNVHIRTHTGEKPFNCELCGKCFRQKAHLAKHVQIHTAPKPPGKR